MVWFTQIEFCSWELPHAYMIPEWHLQRLLELFDKCIVEKKLFACLFFLKKTHSLWHSFSLNSR